MKHECVDSMIFALVLALGSVAYAENTKVTPPGMRNRERCWKSVSPMPTPRFGLAAASGLDGRIYALGGSIDIQNPSAGVVDAVEVYDPSKGTWAPVQPMPTARVYLAAATDPDGLIYAIGGVGPNSTFLNVVERYDPATNAWSPIGSLPENRCCFGATTGSDGRIYSIGGFDRPNRQKTVYAYDPIEDAWVRVADLLFLRAGGFFTVTDTKGTIFTIGGIFDDDMTLGTVEAYDYVTWETRRPMPTPRRFVAGVLGQDGRIYALGGTYGITGFPGTVLFPNVEAYNPNDDTWSLVTSMPTARGALAAATDLDGTIYAIGGWDGFDVLASVLAYRP
jgi:N-acetylneuraminic acid mutarotase